MEMRRHLCQRSLDVSRPPSRPESTFCVVKFKDSPISFPPSRVYTHMYIYRGMYRAHCLVQNLHLRGKIQGQSHFLPALSCIYIYTHVYIQRDVSHPPPRPESTFCEVKFKDSPISFSFSRVYTCTHIYTHKHIQRDVSHPLSRPESTFCVVKFNDSPISFSFSRVYTYTHIHTHINIYRETCRTHRLVQNLDFVW